MHPLPRRRLYPLCLAAVLGPGCLVNSTPTPTPTPDPCTPNPCTQSGKTTCVNESGTARCLCDPGTVLRPSGACEPVSASNCPVHPDAGDSAEPDDCISRAVALTPTGITPRQQSIDPVGDYDFFRIDATALDVYVVSVQAGDGSLLPRVDVFDEAGAWLTSQDGNPKVQLGFKAKASAPYYVRVSQSPLDPSTATGQYALSLADPVQDDYGDSATDATSLTPAAGGSTTTFRTGVFEYGQDADWFSFAGDSSYPNALYRVEFDTSTGNTVPALAVYINGSLDSALVTSQNTYVEFKANTSRFYLALTPPKGAPGKYGFKLFEFPQ